VALAGHQHVFDPWQAHLGRLAGQARDHRAQARRAGGLGFLAAETAAHAAHVDDDLVHRHVEHFGHQFLHFGGVLRRAVDDHAAVFGGHHRGNLRFQVEVFLAADVQRALDAVFGGGQAAAESPRWWVWLSSTKCVCAGLRPRPAPAPGLRIR
jgi:hypothetical protein